MKRMYISCLSDTNLRDSLHCQMTILTFKNVSEMQCHPLAISCWKLCVTCCSVFMMFFLSFNLHNFIWNYGLNGIVSLNKQCTVRGDFIMYLQWNTDYIPPCDSVNLWSFICVMSTVKFGNPCCTVWQNICNVPTVLLGFFWQKIIRYQKIIHYQSSLWLFSIRKSHLDYSPHSFRSLSCASHPHSPCCISRVSLVSAITLPCLSRSIINRNHRAKSLAFIIHNHPAISLVVDHYPQSRCHVSRVSLLSTITLPCLASDYSPQRFPGAFIAIMIQSHPAMSLQFNTTTRPLMSDMYATSFCIT